MSSLHNVSIGEPSMSETTNGSPLQPLLLWEALLTETGSGGTWLRGTIFLSLTVYKVSGLQEYTLHALGVPLEGLFILDVSFKSHKVLAPYDNSFLEVVFWDLNLGIDAFKDFFDFCFCFFFVARWPKSRCSRSLRLLIGWFRGLASLLLPDCWQDKANFRSLVCSLFGLTDRPSSFSCRLMPEPL